MNGILTETIQIISGLTFSSCEVVVTIIDNIMMERLSRDGLVNDLVNKHDDFPIPPGLPLLV